MTLVRRARSVTVMVVLGSLLLSGCTGGDPAASPTPAAEPTATASSAPPSESSSPSPTPTVEPPERPAALDDTGVEGAKAAATYFAMLDTYIMATNDTTIFDLMSHDMCEWCANRLEQAQEIAMNDYDFDGGGTAVRVREVFEQDAATGIWPVELELDIDPVTVTDEAGAIVFQEDATSGSQTFEVIRDDVKWVVVGVVNGEREE